MIKGGYASADSLAFPPRYKLHATAAQEAALGQTCHKTLITTQNSLYNVI